MASRTRSLTYSSRIHLRTQSASLTRSSLSLLSLATRPSHLQIFDLHNSDQVPALLSFALHVFELHNLRIESLAATRIASLTRSSRMRITEALKRIPMCSRSLFTSSSLTAALTRSSRLRPSRRGARYMPDSHSLFTPSPSQPWLAARGMRPAACAFTRPAAIFSHSLFTSSRSERVTCPTSLTRPSRLQPSPSSRETQALYWTSHLLFTGLIAMSTLNSHSLFMTSTFATGMCSRDERRETRDERAATFSHSLFTSSTFATNSVTSHSLLTSSTFTTHLDHRPTVHSHCGFSLALHVFDLHNSVDRGRYPHKSCVLTRSLRLRSSQLNAVRGTSGLSLALHVCTSLKRMPC